LAEPREVDYIETEAGGRPAMWAVPKHGSTDRVLLCVHGGGFVGGSANPAHVRGRSPQAGRCINIRSACRASIQLTTRKAIGNRAYPADMARYISPLIKV
jgi:hypothetical protein